jgi:membrane-bound metal-dependent hydrolase YbcI (DUF457 family)
MPNAVAHILIPLFLIEIVRHYFMKRPFPRQFLLLGGIAGLFPDIDIPFEWVYEWFTGTNVQFHGGLTHTLVWPALFGLLALVFYRHRNYKIFFTVVAFGWFVHVMLDCMLLGPYYPLLPFSAYNGMCFETFIAANAAALDAIIFVIWLVHEEYKHKIKDYF